MSYQGETSSQVYGDTNKDTLYSLASISKFFTAAVCSKLFDEGGINLDKPLKDC
ncbi:serine hydrolase [Lactobacillus sp. B4012]|nr:serine hydrolase [Lactobacillus sp. B4010]MCX8732556.1 serine hydrolase [Lactobacillus sp. B4015]MCX8734776.1 serine hydrolase [Lactobacillus sp. B4012]QYN57694.1 serine hydrolase [Lactobacillus panisapium]